MADTKNNTGEENSGNWNSGDRNSGYWNSGDRNSADRNSGNWNSGYGNSGDGNSGYGNSGDRNSGFWNSGYGNSGNGNSGFWNSGCFNTDEPNARFFNKETNIKLSDFYNSDACPDWDDFSLNSWVDKEDMTDKEKEEIEGWETMGGYLKTLDYKEAWAIFWKETSEENRQKFLNLPNFTWEIFTSITGIKLNKEIKEKGKIVKIKLKDGQTVEGTIVEDE